MLLTYYCDTQKQSQNSQENNFAAVYYSIANKADSLHEEQKTLDLKLQQKISKTSSFSRYLENGKSRNVLM